MGRLGGLESFRLFGRCGRGGGGIRSRFGKLRIVNSDILLHCMDLDGRSGSGLPKGNAKGDLHPVDGTVVGVVDLRGIATERGLCVTHDAHEQA